MIVLLYTSKTSSEYQSIPIKGYGDDIKDMNMCMKIIQWKVKDMFGGRLTEITDTETIDKIDSNRKVIKLFHHHNSIVNCYYGIVDNFNF